MKKAKSQIPKETRIFTNNFVFSEQYSHLIALFIRYVNKICDHMFTKLLFRKKLAKYQLTEALLNDSKKPKYESLL